MVLHGVQHVAIVDDAVVTDDDLFTNFCAGLDSKGKYRAEVAAALLTELNPDCTITAVTSPPDSLAGIADLPARSVVMTTGNRPPGFLRGISEIAAARNFRQAHFQTSGFFGPFYLDGGVDHLIEGVPAGSKYPGGELRILNPFPALAAFWDSFDIDSLDDTAHSPLPFPLLLHRANRELRAELCVDRLVTRHKAQLVAKLLSYRRPNGDDGFKPNEGIEQAIEMAAFGYGVPLPPIDTVETFALLDEIGDSEEPFWQLVRGAKNFFDRHGALPHYGDCPDMEGLPRYFRAIKDIYKAKSDADWAEVLADGCITAAIDPEFARRFAANVWRIGAFIYERLPVYLGRRPPTECWDPSEKTKFDQRACVQLLFVAARQFAEEHGRSPGKADSEEVLRRIVQLGAPEGIAPDFANEFCRYDATVLPSVVASLAAIMAGEVTKLIIGQANPPRASSSTTHCTESWSSRLE